MSEYRDIGELFLVFFGLFFLVYCLLKPKGMPIFSNENHQVKNSHNGHKHHKNRGGRVK